MIGSTHARSQRSHETDSYRGDVPARLPTRVLRELSKVDPLRSVVAIASEWAAIVMSIVIYQRFLHPAFLPLLIMWIGARQHALGVLMHEGAHYLLFKNRKLNELVSELFLAWPLFITTRAYRGSHFAHHRHVNTERDPDLLRRRNDAEWKFPKTWKALRLMLLKDVTGLNTHQQLLEAVDLSTGQESPRGLQAYTIARLLYYGLLLGLVTYFRVWPIFLLLWIVPLLTWLKLILRIRSIAEHFAVENDHAYTRSRTTFPSLFERAFVAPRYINYHLEHHLYPSVPFYRLPQLHACLMENAEFQSRAHLTSTYWGVLRECVCGGGTGRNRAATRSA